MKRTSIDELSDLLRQLGVESGDNLYVTAFLPSLGVVQDGLQGIYAACQQVLGHDGTLIVPTFTYSYRRGEVYDVRGSESSIGAFTEFVRCLPGTVRSLDPLFSMAAIGASAEALMHRPSPACFGDGSVFENLFGSGIRFLGLGVDWDQGYTFFMHLERLAGIPMRRDQLYTGQTLLPDGTLIEDQAVHFVRHEPPKWRRNRVPVCRQLVEAGAAREVITDGCAHRIFDSGPTAELVLEWLAKDPWCMADRLAGAA